MSDDILKNLVSYLGVHAHLRLATVSEDRSPMVHTVAYVSEGSTVYYSTDKRTRKAQNILNEPRVSYAVDQDYEDWTAIQGIQM